ncbi:uncharacterized protein STEHIDRAFT_125137 [Stereum hirsutum FP-91666 SS1]|uniref:uncharacterized protein n=1 Tax=Stereum hirsutum (strain FP-91666) TaxID=721885 RepID=UPI000444A040|nr:uncharacterized protein STEHIDRAFT_125137 [Stereum hirsutum FP-91666 SS1]EIM81618.1 hypothetical protein STEHIDRAFT_125137 [Stereum hirsutum FP-91666 SS1]
MVASDQEWARGAFRVFALVVESRIEARRKTDMTGPFRTLLYQRWGRVRYHAASFLAIMGWYVARLNLRARGTLMDASNVIKNSFELGNDSWTVRV